MVSYLTNYIVTDHELTQVSDDIRLRADESLSAPDRLHAYLQLYEVARTIVERLVAFDKAGFLNQIRQELDKLRQDTDAGLADMASNHRRQIDDIIATARQGEEELKKRGQCIDTVLEAMQRVGDCTAALDDIKLRMSELDARIKEYEDIRQSAPFIEMCNLAGNEP